MRELRRIKEDRDVEEAYKVKRYEAYKNAVVEWLEQVPSHWRSTNIRAITKLVVENNRPDLPLLSVYRDYGVILKDSRDDNHNRAGEDLSHYKVVKPGRLVLNKMKTWQGSLGVSQYTGIVSPAYITCDLHEAHNPRFIHFLLRSYQYIVAYNKLSYGVRVDQWDMRYEDFKQLPLYLPPREEQDAIVAFLDHKLAEIDRFIANKQRLIELLKEQKSAIINRVIIQGLELAVQLKPSGIEWIGDIPKHWDVKKIKYVAKIERGIFSHRPRNDPSMYDGPYPFIQTGDVRSADKYIRNYHQTLNESGFSVSKYFRKGTLVMTIAANVADVGILDFDACFPDSLVGFVPYKLIKVDYLFYLLLSMREELLKTAPINTQLNLNIDRIGTLPVAVPPINEQDRIIAYIEAENIKIDSAIGKAESEIELIKEYRTTLISDVVTGKVDVRAAIKEEMPV